MKRIVNQNNVDYWRKYYLDKATRERCPKAKQRLLKKAGEIEEVGRKIAAAARGIKISTLLGGDQAS
jgi:hypothetical protein